MMVIVRDHMIDEVMMTVVALMIDEDQIMVVKVAMTIDEDQIMVVKVAMMIDVIPVRKMINNRMVSRPVLMKQMELLLLLLLLLLMAPLIKCHHLKGHIAMMLVITGINHHQYLYLIVGHS